MRKSAWFIFILSCSIYGYAQEDAEYDIEEMTTEVDNRCPPQSVNGAYYYRRYYCPRRRYFYYRYRNQDATWPSKLQNSYLDDLMR